MGLKGDITEVSHVWHRAPWRVRVALVLSLFLASTSLASLSETVAKWKGFILTGVVFYQQHFRHPIHGWITSWSPWEFSVMWIDGAVIYSLVLAALFRVSVYRFRTKQRLIADSFWLLSMAILPFAYYAISLRHKPRPDVEFLALSISSYLGFIFMILYPAREPRGAGVMLAFIYLVFPPLFVAVLAAVNLGLK